MREVKKLTDKNLDDFAWIVGNAYPGFKIFSADDRTKIKDRLKRLREDSRVGLYGIFEGKNLLGGMRLHDYRMNLRSAVVPTGGVGLAAVDLMHKKEKVCRDLIAYFLRRCLKNGAPMAILWPFRPDFYRNMGFGYGAKIYQYRIKPDALPKGKSKTRIRFLNSRDIPAWLGFYNRRFVNTNGMCEETAVGMKRIYEGYPANRVVIYSDGGKIYGQMIFHFEAVDPQSFLINNIHIKDVLYENREVLSEFMTFLRSQSDQIREIIIDVPDDNLHHLFLDPRNGSDAMMPSVYHQCNTAGVGIMYRVLDIPAVFKTLSECNFGSANCRLKLTIKDSFLKSNNGSRIINFEEGHCRPGKSGKYDLEIKMDIADFSSLLMGAVDFKSLFIYGRAEISTAEKLETVNGIFAVKEPPYCLTAF
jgi:predicted acetyltransferase